MVRLTGSILLMLGFCGLAFDKVKEDQRKIKRLHILRDFVVFLLKEIQYFGAPIPYICREYEKRTKGELKNFLREVCNGFENNPGSTFEKIWLEKIQSYGKQKEERKQLEALCSNFGFLNTGMQQAAIEHFLNDLEKLILQKEKKYQDNKKLVLYFGAMSGLLLSILLL